MRRIVNTQEFLHHDPELFAVWCSLAIVTACGMTVGLVAPIVLHPLSYGMAIVVLHPLSYGMAIVVLSALLGFPVANFHRRA